MVKSNLPCE